MVYLINSVYATIYCESQIWKVTQEAIKVLVSANKVNAKCDLQIFIYLRILTIHVVSFGPVRTAVLS